jgi:hypothetical protein
LDEACFFANSSAVVVSNLCIAVPNSVIVVIGAGYPFSGLSNLKDTLLLKLVPMGRKIAVPYL